MMITDLIPKGKRQTVVWMDGEPAGLLDNRDVSAYRLEAGSEMEEAMWQKIVTETILPRGKRKALELLQLQDRTTKELHDKLIASEYTEAQTWEIIAYVASFRYIDEQRYAVNYFRAHAKSKSYREMRQVLQSRGVEQDTIETAYEQFVKECGPQGDMGSNDHLSLSGSAAQESVASFLAGAGRSAHANGITAGNVRVSGALSGEAEQDDSAAESPDVLAARRYASRKVHGTEMTAEQRRKVYAGLVRKGFSHEAIRTVLAEYATAEKEV